MRKQCATSLITSAAAAAVLGLVSLSANAAQTLFYTFEDGTDSTVQNFAGGTNGTLNGGTIGPGGAINTTGNVLRLANPQDTDANNDTQYVNTNLLHSQLIGAIGRTDPGDPPAGPNAPAAHDYTMMAVATLDNLTGDNMVFGDNPTTGNGSLHNGFRDQNAHQGHWGGDTTAPAAGTVAAGTQYHVAFRYSDTNGDTRLEQEIFVNGTRVAGPNTVGGLVVDENMFIGTSANNGGLNGTVDNVRVFDNALTDAQIASFAASDVTLIPEPASMTLLGLGAAGLLLRRRGQART